MKKYSDLVFINRNFRFLQRKEEGNLEDGVARIGWDGGDSELGGGVGSWEAGYSRPMSQSFFSNQNSSSDSASQVPNFL